MTSLAAIRTARRQERLSALRQGAAATAAGWRNAEIWLFGSLARGDWDAYSDVDLRAIGRDALRLDQP